jgi:hypothetical protein
MFEIDQQIYFFKPTFTSCQVKYILIKMSKNMKSHKYILGPH